MRFCGASVDRSAPAYWAIAASTPSFVGVAQRDAGRAARSARIQAVYSADRAATTARRRVPDQGRPYANSSVETSSYPAASSFRAMKTVDNQ
jgi:hypothetical protein